jgi:DNA-binding protein HU-beta
MTTKAELVTAIAEKAGINKNQAKDALEAFIDAVTTR